MSYKSSVLWQKGFIGQEEDHGALLRELIQTYDSVRKHVEVIVREIAVDLPSYTVHDISHLDALWHVASMIAGDNAQLNPLETFVLGCAFLLHDSAMSLAAYPGGRHEVAQSADWKKLHAILRAKSNRDVVDEDYLMELFLREQHAKRAEDMPFVQWQSKEGPRYIIESGEVRQKLGSFIGRISASHWWSPDQVEQNFASQTIPAPAGYPRSWSIDLLKLACLLRVADACQIDETRAPGFLFSLRRHRLSPYSALHWTFQNKLTQPECISGAIHYASTSPFDCSEAKSWWLLYDTLKIADRELRSSDDILARCRGDGARFSARRIANIESPLALASTITISGWMPTDTSFAISDIPRMIANLGGAQLYGARPTVAIRELIQNAMDATRIRRITDPSYAVSPIKVEIETDEIGTSIKIVDFGIGMSATDLIQSLLSFGESGWLKDSSIGEYNIEIPTSSNVSGRYGIGFFSVFMIAKKVKIRSRRFDKSADDTSILIFNDGLDERPILIKASGLERMTSAGTEIEILLEEKAELKILSQKQYDEKESLPFRKYIAEFIRYSFPAAEIIIEVKEDGILDRIDNTNWWAEPVDTFLHRIHGPRIAKFDINKIASLIQLIKSEQGEILGRACLYSIDEMRFRARSPDNGALVSKGARIASGRFLGVIMGNPTRASRDLGTPIWSTEVCRKWANEQANKVAQLEGSPEIQMEVASAVISLGGDSADLKICQLGDAFYSLSELREKLSSLQSVWVCQDAAIYSCLRNAPKGAVMRQDVISVDVGYKSFLWSDDDGRLTPDASFVSLGQIVEQCICQAFGVSEDVYLEYTKVLDGRDVYGGRTAVLNGFENEFICRGQKFYRGMNMNNIGDFMLPDVDGDL
jgi:hypothetical protein